MNKIIRNVSADYYYVFSLINNGIFDNTIFIDCFLEITKKDIEKYDRLLEIHEAMKLLPSYSSSFDVFIKTNNEWGLSNICHSYYHIKFRATLNGSNTYLFKTNFKMDRNDLQDYIRNLTEDSDGIKKLNESKI